MVTIYVNLHKDYDYSTAIIGEGYILELKDYVKYVDWIDWAYPNRRQLNIYGGFNEDKIEKHIERTRVFLQRMVSVGAEVFIRNERKDSWTKYVVENPYTTEELVNIECQLIHQNEEEKWFSDDIKKFKKMADWMVKNGESSDDLNFVHKLIADSEEKLKKCRNEEKLRQQIIRNLWKTEEKGDEA